VEKETLLFEGGEEKKRERKSTDSPEEEKKAALRDPIQRGNRTGSLKNGAGGEDENGGWEKEGTICLC